MISANPNLAPGFRFNPTDEEIVGHYLHRKVSGLPLCVDAIAEIDLYKKSPWDLPSLSRLQSRDRVWFFFSHLDRKYDRSSRPNRATADGFWKSTGKDRAVVDEATKVAGMKKVLVFHIGRAPKGQRTDWVMHEYRLKEEDEKSYNGVSFVLCRVFQKRCIGAEKGDQCGARFNEAEWEEEEAQDFVGTESDEWMHSDDFEQGTSETTHNIDLSLNLNPPSKDLLAPGFRFCPTDEELVSYYLKRKVSNLPLRIDAIAVVSIYKYAPWNLPSLCRNHSIHNKDWYFFSALDRKYTFNLRSHQTNRATPKGYWKTTGHDRPIRSHASAKIVGMKKTLVFYTNRARKVRRTEWVMHEYRLVENEQNSTAYSFVVCKIHQKTGYEENKGEPRFVAPVIELEESAEPEFVAPVIELEEPAQPEFVSPVFELEETAQRHCGAPVIELEEIPQPQFVAPVTKLEETAKALVPFEKVLDVPNAVVDVSPHSIIGATPGKSYVHTSYGCDQGIAAKTYIMGSQVEIAYIRNQIPVAWYTATVMKVVDERILLVEYLNLRNEDGTMLSEIVSTQYIRPRPPSTLEVRNFELLDEVEAFYNGGWWPGVVARVKAGSQYNVKFMHLEEEIEFNNKELRLLYDWVDGQWIQTSKDKPIESQNHSRSESIGHMHLLHSSDTAHKCEVPDSITPPSGCEDEVPSDVPISSVNYVKDNSDESTFQSEEEKLRPCKKVKKAETTEDKLNLRGSGTSNAVKTGFDVQTPIIEEEPNFIKDLVDKSDFLQPAADNHQKKELVCELDRLGDKAARQHTSGQKKRKNCRPQKSMIIPLEGSLMGNQPANKVVEPPIGLSAAQCGTCSINGSEAQGLFNVMTSSSDVSLVEMAHTEKTGDSLKPGLDKPLLPFEKCSSVWDFIESMEAFHKMPQQPHFQPLEQYCKYFREGMAIGLMVTFSSIADIVGKLEISDSFHKFDKILKTLMHLEANGFDVQCMQSHVMELIKMTENKERHEEQLLVKEKRGKVWLNVEIESIEKASMGLRLSLSKLNRLEMDSRRVEDALLSTEREFEVASSAI